MIDNNERSHQSDAVSTINRLREAGINPYPERFEKDVSIGKALELDLEASVKTAGRIILERTMGKLTFAHIQDYSGKIQIVLKADTLGDEQYKLFIKNFRPGDFVGVSGKMFVTKVGEKSILVDNYTFLGKALLPLPEKWAGLQDQETKYRQRYLDLISNPETMKSFVFRSNLISKMREFYSLNGFLEVETPTLMHSATGAVARPYITHNNALDIDLFLRISHELPMKELIVGGFDKIFEIGKAFRNEGVDVSHLPEHTHLEHYVAYWNYEDNMDFIEKMFRFIFEKINIPLKFKMEDGTEVDFSFPWTRLNFIDLMKEKTGIDVMVYKDANELRNVIKAKGHQFEGMDAMSISGLVDNLYKKVVRPSLINPTILYYYPIDLQPLARRNDKDPKIVDQFQLVINGWEIVKAYSELVDPIDQEKRFIEQTESKERGEDEVMEIDSEYIEAMSYGMPPISGLGIGIDRLVALLLGKSNLRDVVFFPLLRPKDKI
jgi:lysyl-tRNA synthetase class 2